MRDSGMSTSEIGRHFGLRPQTMHCYFNREKKRMDEALWRERKREQASTQSVADNIIQSFLCTRF